MKMCGVALVYVDFHQLPIHNLYTSQAKPILLPKSSQIWLCVASRPSSSPGAISLSPLFKTTQFLFGGWFPIWKWWSSSRGWQLYLFRKWSWAPLTISLWLGCPKTISGVQSYKQKENTDVQLDYMCFAFFCLKKKCKPEILNPHRFISTDLHHLPISRVVCVRDLSFTLLSSKKFETHVVKLNICVFFLFVRLHSRDCLRTS